MMEKAHSASDELPGIGALAGLVALVGVLVWSYASPIAQLTQRWWNEADYQYCFLVPAFSAWLLWYRREDLADVTIKGSWWGLVLLLVTAVMRWAAAYLLYPLLDPLSLVPCIAGLVLLIGGWQLLLWAAPAIVFLVFMVPLPGFIAGALSHPLQRIGTIVSCYILQTLGIPAVWQGNVIRLSETQLGVVEACSGIRMMMLFFTVCVGAAMVMRTGLLEKIIVVLSAAPIAVLANVIRITVTGILHETAGETLANAVYHDLAGWIMMPMAILLLGAETWLLSVLLHPPAHHMPLSMGRFTTEEVVQNASHEDGEGAK